MTLITVLFSLTVLSLVVAVWALAKAHHADRFADQTQQRMNGLVGRVGSKHNNIDHMWRTLEESVLKLRRLASLSINRQSIAILCLANELDLEPRIDPETGSLLGFRSVSGRSNPARRQARTEAILSTLNTPPEGHGDERIGRD